MVGKPDVYILTGENGKKAYEHICNARPAKTPQYTEEERKEFSKQDRQKLLRFIVSKFHIISENEIDFKTVLLEEDLADLEDSLQMQCAKKENLDYIITENIRDFMNSSVKVLSTNDFLKLTGLI